MVLVMVVLCASTPARAEECLAVSAALARVRAQQRVHVYSQVTRGRHPEGFTQMDSYLFEGVQSRFLDGHRFGPRRVEPGRQIRDLSNGTTQLEPAGDCEGPLQVRLGDRITDRFDYAAHAERGMAQVRIWIARDTGLPVGVRLDGPELTYSRALSRPGKPPQVTLKATGARYLEWQVFRFASHVQADEPRTGPDMATLAAIKGLIDEMAR